MLRVYLFGGLSLAWDDDRLPSIPGTTARSLLAYLLTYRDRPHTRDLLAGTFWPDLPDASARRRLSQALWQIRRALDPHPVLLTEGDTIQWNPKLPLWLDIEEFARHKAECATSTTAALEHCEICIEQYQGEFLAGYYDDWTVPERERLQGMLLDALGQSVAGYKGRTEYERALTYARRLAAEDPWQEEAHREVMRLCHLLGQDAEALKQFEVCRQVLAEELDAEPSPETTALALEIASRSELVEPPTFPSSARRVTVPRLERPDRLPLVGRQAELAELLRQLEAAAKAHGGLTVVYGEAGVGKSRLLRELAENAQWRGLGTVWGRCYELAAPPAYQSLVEALRADLPTLSESSLEPLWRAELSRLLPELATGDAPHPLAPAEEQRRLLEAISRGFLALAEAAPHLVLLEDAQWMDPASLEALRYLLPRLGETPLLVVVTVRSEELAQHAARLLSALESTRLARRLELGRLSLAETEELVQRALELNEPAPRFSARLYAETEGNPFFLVETLWTLVEEGLLYRDEAGEWSTPWDESTQDYAELPLPAGVVQSIERRLERLPGELGELLNIAAVMGRGLDFSVWLGASGWEEGELLAAGDKLCARGLLLAAEGQVAAGADYAFAHDHIRRVAYRRLAPPRRRLYHRRVAEALADLAPEEPAALAYHWTQAEVWGQAVACHQRAGDLARSVYANAEAVAHYSQALNCLERLPDLGDPACRYELHLSREAVYDLLGQREAQAKDLEVLGELAAELADAPVGIEGVEPSVAQRAAKRRAEVALRHATYADATGDYPAAIAAAQEAIRQARVAGDVRLEAEGHRQWGQALWRQGNLEAARAKLGAALELARTGLLHQVEAECLRELGNVCGNQGDYTQAEAYLLQALRISEEIGDRRAESYTHSSLGSILGRQGQYAPARAHLLRSLHLKREIGDRWGEAGALNNLGIVCRLIGDIVAAREYYQQSLSIKREIGDLRGVCTSLINLGNVCHILGDYAAARAYQEQALHHLRELGDRLGEGIALTNLGSIHLSLGDYTQAKTYIEQALEIKGEVGDREGMALSLSHLSRATHHLGNDRAALEYAQRALSTARDLGNRTTEAVALETLASALLDLEELADADKTFQKALDLRRELGEEHLTMFSLVGLARVALARGDPSRAKAKVEEIVDSLLADRQADDQASTASYLTCYQVLRTANDPRATELLRAGYERLQQLAAMIPDEGTRQSFLENVPANREILAAYQEQQGLQPGHQIAVSLPRAGAPLGRPLRDDEFVRVTWTVDAAEDGRVPGKVARRRHRILRLLSEAQAQGATPRDEDLARALSVSLSTVRRDMAALRAKGHALPTRWRKMAT